MKTGDWTATDSGIGAGVDSYFEYLLKGGVMLQRDDYLEQLNGKRKKLLVHLLRIKHVFLLW